MSASAAEHQREVRGMEYMPENSETRHWQIRSQVPIDVPMVGTDRSQVHPRSHPMTTERHETRFTLKDGSVARFYVPWSAR